MIIARQQQIASILNDLLKDAKYDIINMAKAFAKNALRPLQPVDFKDAYLSISKEQGMYLTQLIKENHLKNVVEFGTSFGVSTLFLAQGVLHTGGHILTTELIESKAQKAMEHFSNAGVRDLIELRIGDALETLNNHTQPIDLLLLDGWKDLYLPLFQMLEPNFHDDTFIYVDNADMTASRKFLSIVGQNPRYKFRPLFNGKVVVITT